MSEQTDFGTFNRYIEGGSRTHCTRELTLKVVKVAKLCIPLGSQVLFPRGEKA